MKTKLSIVPALVLSSLVLAAPAAAQASAAQTSTEAQRAVADDLVPAPIFQSDVNSLGSCDVTNECSGNCPSIRCSDSGGDCHSGEDWVQCGDQPRKYCCQCSATADCLDGSYASCSGTYNCFAVTGCYAYCDGQKYWCANPQEPCLEIN